MIRYLEIIRYQVYANMKAEASRGGLGLLWWIVEPILFMSAFYVVFGVVLNRGGENFIPFLLTGLTAWKWFGTSVLQGAMSIQNGAGLMRQVHLPKSIFLIVVLITNACKFLVVLVLLLLFLVLYGIPVGLPWISLPFILITQVVFIFSVSGILCAYYPFFPDSKILIENGVLVGMFLSGVFFDINNVGGGVQQALMLNPMALIIDNYRIVLLEGNWPNWLVLSKVFLLSLFFCGLAYKLIQRFDRTYPKIVT